MGQLSAYRSPAVIAALPISGCAGYKAKSLYGVANPDVSHREILVKNQ